MQLTFIGKFLVFGSHLYSEFCSPVRYAKFQSIRYFIDIDILQNSLIDIDIFKKVHIDIDIDIDILTKNVDILSIFQKMPIYRQSISIFHQKSMKKVLNLLKKMIFLPKMSLSISISISIFSR